MIDKVFESKHTALVIRKFRTLLGLPLREKFWLLLLFFLSGVTRAVLLTLPFRSLAPFLGNHYQKVELSPIVSQAQLQLARQIGQCCETIARYTPWESKCLVQAIMATALLKWYCIPYVLHLGVAKSDQPGDEKLLAHAWVKVGPSVITGRAGHQNFCVVSTFVSQCSFYQLP